MAQRTILILVRKMKKMTMFMDKSIKLNNSAYKSVNISQISIIIKTLLIIKSVNFKVIGIKC